VPWLSVAVSHSGRMVQPQPSKAVIGDVTSSSVTMYDLVSQVPSSAMQSVSRAESDGILTDASISYADDATTLRFRASNSWLSTFVGSDPSVWLLWSHGSELLPHSFPSYHADNRGALTVPRDQLLGHSDGTGDVFDEQSSTYDHQMALTNEYRVAWTVNGAYPSGSISIMMQARTQSWVGFGLRPFSSNTSAGGSGNGMVDVDIYMGMVKDGEVLTSDSWSVSPEAPLDDATNGHTNDIYDVGGREENGITTIWFSRALVTEDTWDYDINPGVAYPIIFAYCRKDVDSFTLYHGPTRGFDHIIFIAVDPPPDLTMIPVAIGACLGVLLLLRIAECIRKRLEAATQRAARLEALRNQVDSSLEASGTLEFGMVLVNARDFLHHGRFLPYETLRDLHQLKVLDTISAAEEFARDQIIIFFSHQWLGWDEPDPKSVHYSCMAKATKSIMDNSKATEKNTWVWVDFSCMPQLNRTTLGLAVSDLSEVAALASYFVVVAPPTTHCDSQEPSDMTSYQSRGWYDRDLGLAVD
ncbi:MAG: hypothetical protein SGPRY_005079, partial [Prymnesium sp.]